jgi:hypothetical protein
MRHLISAISVLGVLGAPALALAADKKADLRDARCIAAVGVMATHKKMKKDDEAILTSVMVYSLGRLEGRNETFDLPALMEEALADEDETTLMARAPACITAMGDAMKVLEVDEPSE